ncbi:MAG TPA: thioredoxin domain-containing protein [Longimicrobiales bacterium]|nr:thioredoxin domain-containing protein [Longimicrobiales bacterium]
MRKRTYVTVLAAVAVIAGPVRAQQDLDGIGHVEGRPEARVQIIEFADYSCAFCARFSRETLPLLRHEWIDTGRASLRFIGFHNTYYKQGREAGRAAECAAEQDAFAAMHDLIYERQTAWLSRGGARERFEEWASELDLDTAAFRDCWERDPGRKLLERNTEIARDMRVRATPTFFISGRKIEGALTYAELREILEALFDSRTAEGSTHIHD